MARDWQPPLRGCVSRRAGHGAQEETWGYRLVSLFVCFCFNICWSSSISSSIKVVEMVVVIVIAELAVEGEIIVIVASCYCCLL